MNYSKKYIVDLANKTGYIAQNIEKSLRLLDTLEFIFTRSSFSDALSLKGGTAINLLFTNLQRLSVDIDLDYHRHLEKEKMAIDRNKIIHELDDYMVSQGYSVSSKSREHAILTSRTYSYIDASGNNDNIKVDINFIDRITVYPLIKTPINYFDQQMTITTPIKEELYGMKIAALLNRSKPRDLYDANGLFQHFDDIDVNKLRQLAIFYLSLDEVYAVDDSLYQEINRIKWIAVRKELFPVINRKENFNLQKTQEYVIQNLREFLIIDCREKEYLDEFSKGNYRPELLFNDDAVTRAQKHPMAIWRTMHNQK